MDRRRFFRHAAGGAVAALTAGCSSDDDSPSETTSEPRQTTPADPEVETLKREPPDNGVSCDDDVEPVDVVTDESFPEQSDGLELTSSTDTVGFGDEITFSLRNVGTEVTNFGSIHKYAFQRRDGDG